MNPFSVRSAIAGAFLALAATSPCSALELLNVSYDPTRELYREVNDLFVADFKGRTGQKIEIQQSHGGSGKQARAVIEGLEADVLTLALPYDIDVVSRTTKLLSPDWRQRLPSNSCPFHSTIVFLVRSGNPKGIKDWADLAKPGVSVVMPNPKTSGGARYIFLAAWGYGERKLGNADKARTLVKGIYANAPVLDAGARGSTTTFTQRKQGDVLVSWENEAWLSANGLGKGKYEVVYPSMSILAETPVAWVDQVVQKKGTAAVAKQYLEFLYKPQAQRIASKHYYRPSDPTIAKESVAQFPALPMFGVDEQFGSWDKAHARFFSDGAEFDKMTQPGK